MTVEGWIAEATEYFTSQGTLNTVVALDIDTAAKKIRENVDQEHSSYEITDYYKWDELENNEEDGKMIITEQGWVFSFRKIEIHTDVDVEVEIHG